MIPPQKPPPGGGFWVNTPQQITANRLVVAVAKAETLDLTPPLPALQAAAQRATRLAGDRDVPRDALHPHLPSPRSDRTNAFDSSSGSRGGGGGGGWGQGGGGLAGGYGGLGGVKVRGQKPLFAQWGQDAEARRLVTEQYAGLV